MYWMEGRLTCTVQEMAMNLQYELVRMGERWNALVKDRALFALVSTDVGEDGTGNECLTIKLNGQERVYVSHPLMPGQQPDHIVLRRATQNTSGRVSLVTVEWRDGADECGFVLDTGDGSPGLPMSVEELARHIMEPLLFGGGSTHIPR